MRLLSSAAARLGLFSGLLCGAVGLSVSGPDAALLWGIVGYFLGKALQSTLRTLADPTG